MRERIRSGPGIEQYPAARNMRQCLPCSSLHLTSARTKEDYGRPCVFLHRLLP